MQETISTVSSQLSDLTHGATTQGDSLEFTEEPDLHTLPAEVTGNNGSPVAAVEYSQSVDRWLDKADAAYRSMFYKRVARLAEGSRSYALSKCLKHCEFPICETKLDAGQRILWTFIWRDRKQHVMVS